MLILGIETSCDETAVSLLEVKGNKTKILTNAISSQVKLHAKYGGVFPSLAAREHIKNLPKVLKLGLGKTKMSEVDIIAVTRGPGLVSSLFVGVSFVQALAWKYKKPIVGVNHLEGHIASNWLSASSTPRFPALCLIVSGGHTELVLMKDFGKYQIIGQTVDDAAGEAFDKIARILELGYPGGPAIAKEAEKLDQKTWKLGKELTRPMIGSKDFNFSFSGLKTSVLYLARDLTKEGLGLKKIKTAIADEVQKTIVDVLVTKTIKAAKKYKVKSVMLSGGVSANKLLRTELSQAARSEGLEFFRPEMEYTTDNAAMIALAGYFSHKKQKTDWKSVNVDSNLSF